MSLLGKARQGVHRARTPGESVCEALFVLPACPADKHHTLHGGHGKHGLWGMGSTLVLQNKRRWVRAGWRLGQAEVKTEG